MKDMDSKEEISDTDSGIILQSGPDSPTSPIKDLTTHTRAMKLKHKALEDRLELCLLELRKLCVREAELTGQLSSDYPLLPGEKPPRIRRRIGAAFKLSDESIWQDGGDPELQPVEAELALQQQIYEAARMLALEEHLSKQLRRSRQQQCKREGRKVKELQEVVLRLRLQHGGGATPPLQHTASQRDPGISDDSSLSDTVALDDDVESTQSSLPASETPVISNPQKTPEDPPQPLPPSTQLAPCPTLVDLRSGEDYGLGLECSPIQNSPWKESSLDQPYQNPRKPQSARSSRSSSPAMTAVSTPGEPQLGDAPIPFPLASIKSLPLHHAHSNSAPSTPELHTRRQYSQSFRLPNKSSQDSDQRRGRAQLPRRRLTDFTTTSPQYSPLRLGQRNPLYLSSSEDSNSEQSLPSYTSSPCREVPVKVAKPCPPPYGYHFSQHNKNGGAHHSRPLAFTGPSFYRVSQHQSTPSFYRVCAVEEGIGCPPEIDMGRLCLGPPLAPPPFSGPPARRERWYEEAPPLLRVLRPPPPQSRLARAPSLREYPHHPSLGLPRELVSEELKSWHQRSQVCGPRPRSLDRQGAFRLRNVSGRDSPLSQQHHFPQQQFPQRRVLQRAPDGTPVQWYVEEDSEIVSQV